jgi:Spy/CpxP family protein refolding chaperone
MRKLVLFQERRRHEVDMRLLAVLTPEQRDAAVGA